MTKTILTRENSKGTLQNYTLTQGEQTIFPNFDLNVAAEVVFADPVVNGASKHFVDKVMEGRYHLLKKDTNESDKQTKDRLEYDYQFSTKVLRSLAIQAFRYGNAFLEIVRGGGTGEVIGLNVLDAKNIKPVTKPNGDPEKYLWRIPDPVTKKFASWTPDEVIWFKFYDSSEGWSPIDIKAIYPWVALKSQMRKYQNWLISTGQYRVIYNLEDAKDKFGVDDFLAFMNQHDEDPTKPFMIRGKLHTMMARDMKELESFHQAYKYIDSQILIGVRIPPIDAGIPDASGRSNADAQSNNLSTTVTGWKKVIKNAIDSELLPALNKNKSYIIFGPNDRFQKKQVFDELNILANLGFSEDAMKEHLMDHGIIFESKELFKKVEEQESTVMEKDIDLMPSRVDDSDGQVQSVGSGEASTTKEEQLKQ